MAALEKHCLSNTSEAGGYLLEKIRQRESGTPGMRPAGKSSGEAEIRPPHNRHTHQTHTHQTHAYWVTNWYITTHWAGTLCGDLNHHRVNHFMNTYYQPTDKLLQQLNLRETNYCGVIADD